MKEYEITIEEVLADQPDLLRALRAVQKLQRERHGPFSSLHMGRHSYTFASAAVSPCALHGPVGASTFLTGTLRIAVCTARNMPSPEAAGVDVARMMAEWCGWKARHRVWTKRGLRPVFWRLRFGQACC